jgi:hypothetical protein
MTSANVTEYKIEDLNGNKVGEYYQSHLCKTHWGDLLKFIPPENFMITAYGLDENEVEWEDKPINLKVFVDKLKKSKYTKWNTFSDLMKPLNKETDKILIYYISQPESSTKT